MLMSHFWRLIAWIVAMANRLQPCRRSLRVILGRRRRKVTVPTIDFETAADLGCGDHCHICGGWDEWGRYDDWDDLYEDLYEIDYPKDEPLFDEYEEPPMRTPRIPRHQSALCRYWNRGRADNSWKSHRRSQYR